MDIPVKTQRGFFSRFDRLAFWAGTVVSFLVYFFTCAPSVTLEDSGELAVAGDYAGVPHPPGYPSWTACAWVFARLLGWVTFRGQPNPAWAIAVMSAFWGALAAGLMALLVSRSAADLLRSRAAAEAEAGRKPGAPPETDDRFPDRAGCIAGVASSLVFAFAPVMWSQCTIVEVYSFNAFFLMLILAMTYRWMHRPSDRLLVLTAFVFGLGLTNYQVLLLALVPLVLVILLQDVALFRDFVLAAIPFGLTAGIVKFGSLFSMPGFEKHAPIDPENPVVGSVNLFDKPFVQTFSPGGYAYWSQPPATPDQISDTRAIYLGAMLLALLVVVAAATLGRLAVLRARGREPSWAGKGLRLGLTIGLGAAALALLALCLSVPSAPHYPQFDKMQDVEAFHWGVPVFLFLCALAALVVFALFTPGGLWFAAAVAGIDVPMAIFLFKGGLLGLEHPFSGYFAVYALAFGAIIALSWLLLERGRTVALTVLAGAVGVGFYLFMPIAGDVCPPMNWGYPRTWEGFKHALRRGQYEEISPQSMFSAQFIHQLGAYFTDVRKQFTLLLAPLGFLPFAAWRLRLWRDPSGRRRTVDLLPVAAACVAAVAALTVLDRLFTRLDLTDTRIDKVILLPLLGAAAIGLVALFAGQLAPLCRAGLDRSRDASSRLVSALSGAFLAFVITAVACCFLNAAAEFVLESGFGYDPASSKPFNVWLLHTTRYDLFDWLLTALLSAGWLAFTGWLFVRAWRRDEPVDSAAPPVLGRWHLATFVCFLMMSVVLIALANPRGDVQDEFIQKVKFIASHGLFALWIGYGLAFGLHLFRRHSALLGALCVAACLTPVIPIWENYHNFALVDKTSGADQNGHDFGWQFGNYQLRGAPAIYEELSEDEEPLPDPFFPPPMTENAVFYGGTDPGRFVPTYMIYSALVRPDVYLITQNALADNTYLDTMRGLYADSIWMPTLDDNRKAFSEYADDVRSGRRPDIGGMTVDAQGRVSVNGSRTVMEINGIIARQIFDRNAARHDFYVEESYPIDWMYPHLTPNGLIMKLNRAPTGFSPALVNADMDFWDWYSRRLLNTPAFSRDVPARKAFCKLRGAIGGAYLWRRDLPHATRALQQAHSLYVYSPETTFRLAQDVGANLARLDRLEPLTLAVEQLERMHRIDPNNASVSEERPDSALSIFRRMRDDSALTAARRERLRAGDTFEDLDELTDFVRVASRSIDPMSAMEPLRLLEPRLDEAALVAFVEEEMRAALKHGTGPTRVAGDLVGARMSSPTAPLSEESALRLLRLAFELGQPSVAGQIINPSLGRKDLSPEFRIHATAELSRFGFAQNDRSVLESASTMYATVPRRVFASAGVSAEERSLAVRTHEAAGNARAARDVTAASLQVEPKNPDRWADYAFYSFVLGDQTEWERGVQGVRSYGGAGAEMRLQERIDSLKEAIGRTRRQAPATR